MTIRGDKSEAVLPYVDKNRSGILTVLADPAGGWQDLAQRAGKLTALESCCR